MESRTISRALGFCAACIKSGSPAAARAAELHAQERVFFGLPAAPPNSPIGARCHLCANECKIASGERGFCGIRVNEDGRVRGGAGDAGELDWYYDPLPTNCVASWVCAEGDAARPHRSAWPRYKNLAVFYRACCFDCLFCQNWHFREARGTRKLTAKELARAVDAHTSCICYFGGDPTPQIAHSIATSREALARTKGRTLRVCWETNGAMHPSLLKTVCRVALESGGCIKFDLKAWREDLHRALCGVSNERTLENFRLAHSLMKERPDPPGLVASTLLVPGYVEAGEVAAIARFLASLDPAIPYSLLAFHPCFLMADLPTTCRRHALECEEAAGNAGLTRVHLGNRHLLHQERY